jgi:hypothetical protein
VDDGKKERFPQSEPIFHFAPAFVTSQSGRRQRVPDGDAG